MVKVGVKNLTTGYEDERILEDISFKLDVDDFIGVVGPNGSGKSTLVRALTGTLPAWDGRVKYDHNDIENLKRKEIAKLSAVVPQDTYINFPFTAWEVVLMGRSPYLGRFENPGKKDKKLAKKAMKDTKTLKFKDSPVKELSGGELQRVLIARSLTQNPEVLFLDEATSHLDIGHKKETMDLIKRKNEKKNVAILSIHHNLNLAARYCEKILLMDQGKIHAFGKPGSVLTRSNLRAVYGVEAEVHEHPKDGTLYVSPVDKKISKEKEKKSIHVVCGGGSAGTLLRELVEDGYRVSTGVLNVMDSDYEKAEFLDIDCVTEAPFSNISSESYSQNVEHIQRSDIVVVTDFPVGEGNIKNIQAVLEGVNKGDKVIVVDGKEIEKRDYTEDGRGRNLYRKLLKRENTTVVNSLEGLKDEL